MQAAFDELKKVMTTTSCLVLPDLNGDFEVTTNAFKDAKAVRVVLVQNDYPVAYESAKLNSHQFNYTIHDKKMCAIIHALKK